MIFSSLEHAYLYECLGRRYRSAFEFLRQTDLKASPLGRHSIDGDDVFALVQENATKPPEQCRWEAHRRYVDIQYVVSGVERMAYGLLERFEVEVPYDDATDVAFFRPGASPGDSIATVSPGHYTIFLPSDVHMPLIQAAAGALKVKKVVIKIRY